MKKAGLTASPKHRRLSVVGGTNSLPSLREVVPHRNVQRKTPRRAQSAMGTTPQAPSTTMKDRTCDLCSKVQRQWKESQNLRKKTLVSDVTVCSPEGERFYCSSFVLALWSKQMLDKAQCEKDARGEEEWTIYLDGVPTDVLQACLRFMYGGSLDEIPPQYLPQLIEMADEYAMPDMKRSCLTAAEVVPLTPENACALWLFADKLRLSTAQERCMRYIYANLENVITTPEWHQSISHRPDLLMALAQASAGWTKQISDWRSVKKDDVPNAVVNGIRSLWQDSEGLRNPLAHSDVTLVTKSGRQFHLHTQLIYTTSPEFAGFLLDECDAGDTPDVYFDDFDDEVVEDFLRFLYCQDLSPEFPQLSEFIHVLASTYHVEDLIRMCEREQAAHELTDVDAAVQMLREAEEHRMSAAKPALFRYLYDHLDELREKENWCSLIKDEPQLLTEMMVKSKLYRRPIK